MARSVSKKIREMGSKCIAVRIRLLNRMITSICDQKLREHNIRVAQVNVLCAIANGGPMTPQHLAKILHMDKSTMSRDVDSLLKKKWVQALSSVKDARSHQLEITNLGVVFLESIYPIWEVAQNEIIEKIGHDFQKQLMGTVNTIWSQAIGKD